MLLSAEITKITPQLRKSLESVLHSHYFSDLCFTGRLEKIIEAISYI